MKVERNGIVYQEISKDEFMSQLAEAGRTVESRDFRTEQHGYTEAGWDLEYSNLIRHTRDGLVIRCYSNRDS